MHKPHLCTGFVRPPYNKRYINNIAECRHCKINKYYLEATRKDYLNQDKYYTVRHKSCKKTKKGHMIQVQSCILGQYPGSRRRNSQ